MRQLLLLSFLIMIPGALPSLASAHDSPSGAQAGVRTVVSLPAPTSCAADSTVKNLGDAFYTRPEHEFVGLVTDALVDCRALASTDRYVVVVFLAKPTDAEEKPVVLHVILQQKGEEVSALRSLPGISSATWIYLTDDASDQLRMELVSTAVENPLIGQLGALAGKVIGALPMKFSSTQKQAVAPPSQAMRFSRAVNVNLPFKRGSVTETLYVQRTVGGKPVQYDAKTVFENVPSSWLTLHAGVGVLTGTLHGASPAKVEDDNYASEPLKRAATLAGVAFHSPFDSTSPAPTWEERVGFVTAAVITPAVGIYLGPSIGWRSFSFTFGPAWMWTPSPPPDLKIGDEVRKPAAGSNEQQLVLGRVRALLIGGTYTFGK